MNETLFAMILCLILFSSGIITIIFFKLGERLRSGKRWTGQQYIKK